MKRALILVATVLAVLALGVAARSKLAVAATSLANQGDGSLLPRDRDARADGSSAGPVGPQRCNNDETATALTADAVQI